MSKASIPPRDPGPVMKSIRVAVVGAGASGLVTAKYLRQAREYFGVPDVKIRIFEREESIGGVYRHKVYEEAELSNGGHRVSYRRNEVNDIQNGDEIQDLFWDCDAIAVCSGLNNVPSIPSIEGLGGAEKVLHSSEVKGRHQFGQNTSVMILGAGETAMDLAHLAVTSEAREVVLCADSLQTIPIPTVMKIFKPDPYQKPVDTVIASFLDTAYLPERLQHSWVPWAVYDRTMRGLH
ncbi:dimethylaniline monooxygenase, partial [Colletotrichum musicola]